jgi:hypothetical protein
MNINSKEREYTANSTLTRRRTRSQKTSGSLRSKLEVFIWRCRAARLWLSSQHSAHVTTARWRHKQVLWVRDLYRCPAFGTIIKALSKTNYSVDIQLYIYFKTYHLSALRTIQIEPCLNSWQYLVIKRNGTQLNGTNKILWKSQSLQK